MIFKGVVIVAGIAFGILVAVILFSGYFEDSQEINGQEQNNETKIVNSPQMTDMTDSDMMIERGNMAMGFDQTKIKHFFEATLTGGEIGMIALDKNDAKTTSEIRSHVEVI